MITYDTVSQAVEGLKQRGYSLDFNLAENCLICEGKKFQASDFTIVEFHRFEGDSDPSDEAVVYAVESKDGKKGVLVNGYGISAESTGADIANKLNVHIKNY
jgi:hypothetical protein